MQPALREARKTTLDTGRPKQIVNVTVFCFLASYTVALGLELSRLLGRNVLGRVVMLLFGGAGLLAHTVYLVNRSQVTGLPPLVGSAHDWLLVLAWLLVLFYLAIALMNRELALGAFVLPVVLALVGAAYWLSKSPGTGSDVALAWHRWKMLHASCLVFGVGCVTGAFVASLMYLVQHRRLRIRHLSQSGWKMPSLERLGQGVRWFVMGAFLFLTLGFGAGVILTLEAQDGPRLTGLTDPLVVASGASWGLLAGIVVWLLWAQNPTGKRVAWMSIGACGLLLITLIGLQVVAGGNHPRLQPQFESKPSRGGVVAGETRESNE